VHISANYDRPIRAKCLPGWWGGRSKWVVYPIGPMRKRRILPPVYLLASIVSMVLLDLLAPVAEALRFPWTLAGLVPLAFGLFLNLSAGRAFMKQGTTVKPFEDSSALVTTGVFRFTRNPMYLGLTSILVGIAILLGSLAPFAVCTLFAVLMDLRFIRVEERMLEAKFGDACREYRGRVRRWI